MKLGRKPQDFYSAPTDNMVYPEISLPAKLFDKGYSVGDKCVIEFTGVIESIDKNSYRVKLLDGAEVESVADDKKEDSLLKKAK